MICWEERHEARHYHSDSYFNMFPVAVYGVPVPGFWGDRAQSDDCPDSLFWIYAGREDRAYDRLFLLNPGRYFLCQCDWILRVAVHVYRLYERQVCTDFLSPGYQAAGGVDLMQRFYLWYHMLCDYVPAAEPV